MCREPVFDAFVKDFIEDCNIVENEGDKLSLDWYDAHVQRCSLTTLFDANVFAIFTENDCTDILSMPDGGAIQILKNKINTIIEATVELDVDAWFGVTPPSKSLRRRTALRALSEAWIWFREEHKTTPHRIGLRTGQIFKLNEDRKVQFQGTRYRGYETEDKSPKNPFVEKTFRQAVDEYKKRNLKRRVDQAARKRKKKEKEEKEEQRKRKKKNKENIKKAPQRRKRKRVKKEDIKVKEESKEDLPDVPVVKIEPVPDPQRAPLVVIPMKRNIQKEVFEDKRVTIEDFLKNL